MPAYTRRLLTATLAFFSPLTPTYLPLTIAAVSSPVKHTVLSGTPAKALLTVAGVPSPPPRRAKARQLRHLLSPPHPSPPTPGPHQATASRIPGCRPCLPLRAQAVASRRKSAGRQYKRNEWARCSPSLPQVSPCNPFLGKPFVSHCII